MILNKINFSQEERKLLTINATSIIPSWDLYYKQYVYAVNLLVEEFQVNRNTINSCLCPFMFLLRHTIEIMLKLNIKIITNRLEITHDLIALKKTCAALLGSEVEKLIIPHYFSDASATYFRYCDNDDGHYEITDILKVLESYNDLSKINGFNHKAIIFTEPNNNKEKLAFRHYYNSDITNGQLATEYDFAVSLMLDRIKNSKALSNDVLIPLLYLMRHSLELSLKSELEQVKSKLSLKSATALIR